MKTFLQIRTLILSISGHPPLSKGLKTYVGIPLNILQYHKEDWHFNRQMGKLQLCFFFLKNQKQFFLFKFGYKVFISRRSFEH